LQNWELAIAATRGGVVGCSWYRASYLLQAWVNRPLKISQLGQLSLSSFRGR